ncbi:hypothetical protein BGX34_000360 [Mortierella sp. NVP85]|nr:hypothetical protein BGX34_000360 [Mortierella sp. NVP85]
MEPVRPLLMIEGPKFSGFDFSPAPTAAVITSGTSHQQESIWVPKPEGTEPFIVNGRRIVLPDKEARVKKGSEQDDELLLSHTARTASSVWDCSILLSKYLEALSDRMPGYWTGKRVLELGAGQGIVSFSAAALGAERVIITDVDSAVPSLQEGVKLNGFSIPQVQVVTLDWTDRAQAIEHIWNDLLAAPPSPTSETTKKESDRSSEGIVADAGQQPGKRQRSSVSRLDYILASDVIWVDYLIPALVDTMKDLISIDYERPKEPEERLVEQQQQQSVLSDPSVNLSRTSSPVVLLAYQFRSTRSDRLLFDALDQLGLKRRKLSLTGVDKNDQDAVELDPKFQKSNLAIWKIWRE